MTRNKSPSPRFKIVHNAEGCLFYAAASSGGLARSGDREGGGHHEYRLTPELKAKDEVEAIGCCMASSQTVQECLRDMLGKLQAAGILDPCSYWLCLPYTTTIRKLEDLEIEVDRRNKCTALRAAGIRALKTGGGDTLTIHILAYSCHKQETVTLFYDFRT
jgi:hypothetical protein